MTDDSAREVRIERTFEASAEDVFDAWTSEEVMRRWFHAGRDWETPNAEVDLRVGWMVAERTDRDRCRTGGRASRRMRDYAARRTYR